MEGLGELLAYPVGIATAVVPLLVETTVGLYPEGVAVTGSKFLDVAVVVAEAPRGILIRILPLIVAVAVFPDR